MPRNRIPLTDANVVPPTEPVTDPVPEGVNAAMQLLAQEIDREVMTQCTAPIAARWPENSVSSSNVDAFLSGDEPSSLTTEVILEAFRRSRMNMQSPSTEREAPISFEFDRQALEEAAQVRADTESYTPLHIHMTPTQIRELEDMRNNGRFRGMYTASQMEEFAHQQQRANDSARSAALVQELRDYYRGRDLPTSREVEQRLENTYNVRGALGNRVIWAFFASLRGEEMAERSQPWTVSAYTGRSSSGEAEYVHMQSRNTGRTLAALQESMRPLVQYNQTLFDEVSSIGPLAWNPVMQVPEPPMDEPV